MDVRLPRDKAPYYPPAIFFECSIKIDVDATFGEMIEIMAQKVPFGVAPVLDSQRTDQKITVVTPWTTPSHYLPVKPEALSIRHSITVPTMCIAIDEATGGQTTLGLK